MIAGSSFKTLHEPLLGDSCHQAVAWAIMTHCHRPGTRLNENFTNSFSLVCLVIKNNQQLLRAETPLRLDRISFQDAKCLKKPLDSFCFYRHITSDPTAGLRLRPISLPSASVNTPTPVSPISSSHSEMKWEVILSRSTTYKLSGSIPHSKAVSCCILPKRLKRLQTARSV